MKNYLLWFVCLIIVLMNACSSSKVVTDSFVMKRKYNKGFYNNLKLNVSKHSKTQLSVDLTDRDDTVKSPGNIDSSGLPLLMAIDIPECEKKTQMRKHDKQKVFSSSSNISLTKTKEIEGMLSLDKFKLTKSNSVSYDLPNSPQTANDALAIISLVFGVLGLLLFWIPFLGLLFSLVAVLCGVFGLNSAERGMAIAGLICGILGVIIGLLWIALIVSWL